MAGGKHTSVQFSNKAVYFGHLLCSGWKGRCKEREEFYKAPGESVKMRQLKRQKQDS